MKHHYFTLEDALGLLGQRRRAKVTFPMAPKGTLGTVTRIDAIVFPYKCTVAIEWDRLQVKPLIDWLTKDEYDALLEEA